MWSVPLIGNASATGGATGTVCVAICLLRQERFVARPIPFGTCSLCRGHRGIEETLHIGLAHRRLARRHVVQLSSTHPRFEFADQFKQMLERLDREQQWLMTVDLEALVDDPLELEWVPLHGRRIDRVRDLAMRAQEPAAIHLLPASIRPLHESEFDAEPEEPR